MNKKFWTQFAIALLLFLAGYFTFNSSFFSRAVKVSSSAICLVSEVV